MEIPHAADEPAMIDFYRPKPEEDDTLNPFMTHLIEMVMLLSNFLRKGYKNPFDNYAYREMICIHIGNTILGLNMISISGRTGDDCKSDNYHAGEIKSHQISSFTPLSKKDPYSNGGSGPKGRFIKKDFVAECEKHGIDASNLRIDDMKSRLSPYVRKHNVNMHGGPQFDIRASSSEDDVEKYKNDVKDKILSWDMFHYIQFSKDQRPLWVIYVFGIRNCNHLGNTYIIPECNETILKTKNNKKKAAQTTIKNFAETLLNETDFPEPELNKVVIMNKDSFDEGEVFNLDNLTTDEFQQKIINIYK